MSGSASPAAWLPSRAGARDRVSPRRHGLTVRTTATNIGASACPYGAGTHPYVIVGTPTVDSVVLQAPGRTRLTSDERGIPTGAEPVDGSQYDFRRPRPIGKAKLDTAFTDLKRDDDGAARVHLAATFFSTSATGWTGESSGTRCDRLATQPFEPRTS